MEQDGRQRQIRKQIVRNRKKKRAPRQNWMALYRDDPEALEEMAGVERIMPPGEQERRQAVLQASHLALEDRRNSTEGGQGNGPAGLSGVVVQVSTGQCRVHMGDRVLLCGLRGSLTAEETGLTHVVAVGDRVSVREDGAGCGVVEGVLPRRSTLARPHPFYPHRAQVIAANVDQVLIVASWRDPHFWPELVDRYLIAARRNRLAAALCVNKIDLAEDMGSCWQQLQPYSELGFTVLLTSALNGDGVAELRQLLQGRTTVLTGLSGVGKSLLLSRVQPGLDLRVGEVNEDSHQGRHTTTQACMVPLEAGGYVIDTPGLREFGLGGLQRADLAGYYPEFQVIPGRCRFANCTHLNEPGCAIRAAVQSGQVSAMRYDSYTKICAGLPG